MRCVGISLTVAFVLALPTLASARQNASAPPVSTISIDISPETMRLYPSLATAAAQTANRVADVSLDRWLGTPSGRGKKSVAHRLVRIYLVTLPIAALGHFAAHEAGHVSRIHEADRSIVAFNVKRWPWPVPYTGGSMQVDDFAFRSRFHDLSMIVGGGEAARVQEEILLDQVYSQDTTGYFNWIQLLYAKLELPLYTWASDLTSSTPRHGDPLQFAQIFGSLRAEARRPPVPRPPFLDTYEEEIAAVSRTVERGMWLNLADYGLVAAAIRSVQYIRHGERVSRSPALRIGSLSLVPAVNFTLTPLGTETGIAVRVITARHLSRIELRATDTASRERLWAVGFELRPRRLAGLAPKMRVDLFERRGDPQTLWRGAKKLGWRLEAGAEKPFRFGDRIVEAGVRVGYKTAGYLVDAPERKTLLAGISMAFRF